jgi:3-oxoadipate enol-lactonase
MTIDSTPLAHDDGGTGPAVMLLHAGIADRRMWRGQVPALQAAGYRMITPDLTGYGESTVPDAPFAHHDRVVELLDHLGIARATVVGCSFGGRVTLDLALAHPHRIDGLALFGAAVGGHTWSAEVADSWERITGDPDTDDVAAVADAEVRFWVVGPDRQPGAVDAELLRFATEMDIRALAGEALLDAADVRDLEPPALGRLAEITAPTLVAVGADDVVDIRTLADRLADELPGAIRLPDVPNAAHLLPLERPEPVNEALLSFLKGLTT